MKLENLIHTMKLRAMTREERERLMRLENLTPMVKITPNKD